MTYISPNLFLTIRKQAEFSKKETSLFKMDVRKKQALAGCAFVAAALMFMVVGFSSPYWVESFEEFKSPFVKLGLWEFCFNDFTFYKDYKGNRYLGCFYIFSREARPIWEWVSPRKFHFNSNFKSRF